MRGSRTVGRGSVAMKAVAGVLCGLLVQPGVPAWGLAGKAAAGAGQIQGDARVLHALNRLTFGPRPGDVAAVEGMGLDRWFERQLNPGTIDDSALEARLDAFPAMRLSQTELMMRYPNPQVIRTIVQKGLPLPSDPVEHALYADQIEFYKMKMAAKAEKGDVTKAGAVDGGAAAMGGAGAPAMNGGGAAGMAAAGGDGQADAQVDAGMKALAEAEVAGGNDPLKNAPGEHGEGTYPEADAQRVLGLGPDARVAAILRMKARELVAFRQSLSRAELGQMVAGLNAQQKETLAALPGSLKVIGAEEMQVRLMRDIYSDRQLDAVMTDFWLNHFNVYAKKSQLEPYLIPAYEREVIRPRALGKFEDLLVATAKSPAMLVYLDNWHSTGPDSQAATRAENRPMRMGRFGGMRMPGNDAAKAKTPQGLNENYGRELMELHTLGVGGGYTQADVTQVAKVFTGWTIDKPYQGGTYGFDERKHEPGSKTVMGKTIHEGGEKEGLEVLHMLATSPATAKFISTKLAVRFVSDDPPAALVDRMTKAFLGSGGDMKVVLRTMFQTPEFWAPGVERAKVKTPLEFVASAVRASGAEVSNGQALAQALDRLGMPLYGMQTPNGYSWKQEPWVSTGALVSRMNFALLLSADRIGGVRTRWTELLGDGGGVRRVSADVGGSSEAVKERKLEAMLLGEPVSERTRATVLAQFDDAAGKNNAEKAFPLGGDGLGGGGKGGRRGGDGALDAQAAGMAGLLLGSPEFQRR